MNDEPTLSGWHRDPSGRHELRFWDGHRWTEHVLDEGIPGLDHPTRSGRPAADSAPTPTPAPPTPVAPTRMIDLAAEADADDALASTSPDTDAGPGTGTDTDAGIDPDSDADVLAATSRDPQRADADDARTRRVPSASPRVAPSSPDPASTPSPAPPGPPGRPVEAVAESNPPEPRVEAAERVEATPAAAANVADTEAPPGRAPEDDAGGPSRDDGRGPDPSIRTDAADAAPAEERRASPRAPRDLPRLAEPRLVADPPSVASPAGNSAGSTTSAIGDPHHHPTREPASPRVGGVVPAPAKRYRPGSPPPSPHVGPRGLPAPATLGPPITPWYRRPAAWVAVLLAVVLAAGTVVLVTALGRDSGSDRLGARPPAAAPRGTKVIENNGVAIAAPKSWIVASDPGTTFPLLKRANWGEPLAAIGPGGAEALVVAPLHGLEHLPQVDPDLFWSGQTGTAERSDVVSFSVHGYRANRVQLSVDSVVIEAAAIDTGDGTYLVAVRAPSMAQAETEFERVIQTFDQR